MNGLVGGEALCWWEAWYPPPLNSAMPPHTPSYPPPFFPGAALLHNQSQWSGISQRTSIRRWSRSAGRRRRCQMRVDKSRNSQSVSQSLHDARPRTTQASTIVVGIDQPSCPRAIARVVAWPRAATGVVLVRASLLILDRNW